MRTVRPAWSGHHDPHGWGGSAPCSHTPLYPAGNPADQKTQWMNQLLYLVQKKNSLMSEESDLMIA